MSGKPRLAYPGLDYHKLVPVHREVLSSLTGLGYPTLDLAGLVSYCQECLSSLTSLA